MLTNRTIKIHLATVIVMALSAASAWSADIQPRIHVSGAVTQPSDWSAGELKERLSSDLTTIQFTSQGKPHSATAVPLLSLLKAAGVHTDLKESPGADPRQKNQPLRLVIVARGRDGYTAVFSLAEMLPEMANEKVWLMFDTDGTPLSESDGPIRLIVPSDAKPGRSVRQLGSIEILDETLPARVPAR